MAHYSAFNLRIILTLTLGSLTYGYGLSVISNTIGQPGFLSYFNLTTNTSYENQIVGGVNGLFMAGGVFGCITAAWMSNRYGRKRTMNVSAAICIIGGALQTGSIDAAMFLVARFITGWGMGTMAVVIPIFQGEVSPPGSRGLFVGQHGSWIVTGYAIAGWIGVGTYYSSNPSFQWRFPIAVQCLWPLLLVLCSVWIPESPRWLLMQGRNNDAWQIVAKLHSSPEADPDQVYAREEFYQMVKQVEMDSQLWARGGGLKQLWTKPSYRTRMCMGFFTQYAAQSTGSMVVYNYIVTLYQDLGFTGAKVLMLGAAYVTLAAAANFMASVLMDHMGRVRLLLIGLTGCMITLSLECAMFAQFGGTNDHVGNSLGVFFIFCYIFFYAGGIDATSYVYCSEIFPNHVRSEGMAWSMIGTFLSTILYLEVGPVALATVKWKYYLLFICLTFINIVVIWKFFPEVCLSMAMVMVRVLTTSTTDKGPVVGRDKW
ncbi:general substrate transporter [Heliocybe sulcata]|uniref:General substrate transporter n=1 Tax=Heliocybe sulcata TaxID=5364 RepID=A0A5C3NG98_9AGAM|nr:general substrate transporter [Heliocybe sulcata]